MRPALLAVPLLFCVPAFAQEAAAPIDPDLARRRIAEIAAAEPLPEQIDALEEIAGRTRDPELSALATYNAGTLALSLDDDRADGLLRRADELSRRPGLRADARYNLAHAAYARANPEAPPASVGEVDERIAGLARAAGLFRSVLDLEPGHADAAANTERVRRKIREFEQLRRQLEERQQMQQELADQLQRLAEQQEQQAAENRSRSEQTDADSTQEQQQSDNQQAAGEQEELSEQTEQAREQSEEAGAPAEAQEAMEQARRAQQRAQEALENNDAESAAQAQQEAAEALRRAAERARPDQPGERPNDQPGRQAGEESSPEPQQSQGEASAEAPGITPLAESLLDKERREREQRMRYLQKSGRQRVERDW